MVTRTPSENRSRSPPPSSSKRMKPKAEKPRVTGIVDLSGDEDEFLFTPIANRGTTKKTAISVEQYSEDRDLNLAIMASLSSSKIANFIDLSCDYHSFDDDIMLLNFKPQASSFGRRRKHIFVDSLTEIGQSSSSPNNLDFVCELCVESRKANELFAIEGCTHAYCTDCMVKYVASRLQENITNICCPVPGCKGLLEPEHCRSIMPQEVFDRWGKTLCEAAIPVSQKFYCPFKDCSAMLINDEETVVTESECPNCRRMFCAQCKVAWHSGIKCEEFQKLHKDEREREDIMLMYLAQNKEWKRCPSCRIYIERTAGCRFMKCRCRTSFCYSCGSTNISRESHFCHNCMC